MVVKIYGQYCSMYDELLKNIKTAKKQVKELIDVQEITKSHEILNDGVMSMPGLAVNGRIVGQGKVFSVDEICDFILKSNNA